MAASYGERREAQVPLEVDSEMRRTAETARTGDLIYAHGCVGQQGYRFRQPEECELLLGGASESGEHAYLKGAQ